MKYLFIAVLYIHFLLCNPHQVTQSLSFLNWSITYLDILYRINYLYWNLVWNANLYLLYFHVFVWKQVFNCQCDTTQFHQLDWNYKSISHCCNFRCGPAFGAILGAPGLCVHLNPGVSKEVVTSLSKRIEKLFMHSLRSLRIFWVKKYLIPFGDIFVQFLRILSTKSTISQK